jgi:hypothetical protein
MRQKNQVELNSGTGAMGEAQSVAARESEASAAETSLERPAVAGPSMEAIVERENLKKALAQVKRNKGAPGIDGMTVEDLGPSGRHRTVPRKAPQAQDQQSQERGRQAERSQIPGL